MSRGASVFIRLKLFLLVVMTLIALCLIGYISLVKLSDVYQTFESIDKEQEVSVDRLRKILDHYTFNIIGTIHQTNAHQSSYDTCAATVQNAQESIKEAWHAYSAMHLEKEQQLVANDVTKMMLTSDALLSEIIQTCHAHHASLLEDLTQNELYATLNPLLAKFQDLIALNLLDIQESKVASNHIYLKSRTSIFYVLCLTIIFLMCFLIIIASRILQTYSQLDATLNAIPDILFEFDIFGVCYDYLDQSGDNTLFSSDVIGKRINEIFPKNAQYCILTALKAVYKHREPANIDFSMHHQGKTLWFEFSVASKKVAFVRNTNNTHYILLLRNITQRKYHEQEILRLAHCDQLTSLSNRHVAQTYTQSLIEKKEKQFALLFIDLDQFKTINDSFGHLFGDQLLILVAKRIRTIVRKDNFVGRQGGDEFILIIPYSKIELITHMVKQLLKSLSRPYQMDNTLDVVITASIGVALYPNDGKDFVALLKSADTAMYNAKKEGKNTYCFFTEDIRMQAMRKMQLEQALRYALENNELFMCYQPQIDIQTNRIVGAESLIRWRHPEFGIVSPVEFIPIAESSGLIVPIGQWVIEHVIEQMYAWHQQKVDLPRIAINLSALQFRQPNLLSIIESALSKTSILPTQIEFELTESSAMEDPAHAMHVINTLRTNGFYVSIDDFGTGYSSLSYLRQFRVSKLKIDRSFIKDMLKNSEDKAIVAAIIGIAQNLGMTVISEGVETKEQLDLLSQLGCDQIQGYYFSKPLDVEAFERFYLDNTSRTNGVRK